MSPLELEREREREGGGEDAAEEALDGAGDPAAACDGSRVDRRASVMRSSRDWWSCIPPRVKPNQTRGPNDARRANGSVRGAVSPPPPEPKIAAVVRVRSASVIGSRTSVNAFLDEDEEGGVGTTRV